VGDASAVLFSAPTSRFSQWEFQHIVEQNALGKTFVIFGYSAKDRLEAYNYFRDSTREILTAELPRDLGRAKVISFDATGKPVLTSPAGNFFRRVCADATGDALYRALKGAGYQIGKPRFRGTYLILSSFLAVALLMLFYHSFIDPGWKPFEVGDGGVAINLPTAFSSSPDWKPFAFKDGGFVVSLPGAVSESAQKAGVDSRDPIVYLATARWKDYYYTVAYAEAPRTDLSPETAEKVLDNTRDGVASGSNAELVTEKPFTLDGFPGRDLLLNVKGSDALEKSRLLLTDDRLIELIVVVPANEESPDNNSSAVQTFFDSLRLER
jgi:hypothetical protein